MRTDLKSNGRSPSASVSLSHAAARVNADLIEVAAAGRYSTSPSARSQDQMGSALPVSTAELLDRRAVCRMFGGSKPINASTLYRGIRAGRFPRPIKIAGSSRWLRDECQAVLRGMMEARS
jgi:predicted DNA-binding transcriptional regulator AlpA